MIILYKYDNRTLFLALWALILKGSAATRASQSLIRSLLATEERAVMAGKRESLASKIDEVARNQIWREQLKTEYLMESALTPFQLNPKTRAYACGFGWMKCCRCKHDPHPYALCLCSECHHAQAHADASRRLR